MEIHKNMNVLNQIVWKFKMKKSQSEIITAVLLILIVIALAVIILNFSTTFVKDKLSNTGCFDVIGQVSFVSSTKYTCLNSPTKVFLKIHLGDVGSISGLLIVIGGANTKSIKITNGATVAGVKMYGVTGNTLELPKKNEDRTYVIDVISAPESVKINAIMDEKVCETSDTISLSSCKS